MPYHIVVNTSPFFFPLKSFFSGEKWLYINLSSLVTFCLRTTQCQLHYSLILQWFPASGSEIENGEIQSCLQIWQYLKFQLIWALLGIEYIYCRLVLFLAEKKKGTMVHRFNNCSYTNYKWPWKSMLCGDSYFIITFNHSALEEGVNLAWGLSHFSVCCVTSEVRQTLFRWENASSPIVMQLNN